MGGQGGPLGIVQEVELWKLKYKFNKFENSKNEIKIFTTLKLFLKHFSK